MKTNFGTAIESLCRNSALSTIISESIAILAIKTEYLEGARAARIDGCHDLDATIEALEEEVVFFEDAIFDARDRIAANEATAQRWVDRC